MVFRERMLAMLCGLCHTVMFPKSPSRVVTVDPALQCTVIGVLDFLIFFRRL